jgi:UDP-glucose 4-epimerase
MEDAVRARRRGPDCTLLRVAGVYGPTRFGYGSHSSRVVERMVYSAALGHPLHLTGLWRDADDMIYVRDVARALAAAVSLPPAARTVNVATGRLTRLEDLADAVRAVFGDQHLTLDPPQPDRAALTRPALDVTRMESLLGPAQFDVRAAIADFAELADLARTPADAEAAP